MYTVYVIVTTINSNVVAIQPLRVSGWLRSNLHLGDVTLYSYSLTDT